MNGLQDLQQSDRPVRTVETEDGVEHVVDLGASERDAAVDVVGETVIVVTGEDQHELSVAAGAEAFIRNGVLTIVTEDSA